MNLLKTFDNLPHEPIVGKPEAYGTDRKISEYVLI